MQEQLLQLFNKMPDSLAIYELLEKQVLKLYPESRIKIGKTQVSFSDRYGYLYAAPPIRRIKGWPEICLIVTIGLGYRLEHPRVFQAVEPYPNRWTHHIIVGSEEEIDDELMSLIAMSYEFSMNK